MDTRDRLQRPSINYRGELTGIRVRSQASSEASTRGRSTDGSSSPDRDPIDNEWAPVDSGILTAHASAPKNTGSSPQEGDTHLDNATASDNDDQDDDWRQQVIAPQEWFPEDSGGTMTSSPTTHTKLLSV